MGKFILIIRYDVYRVVHNTPDELDYTCETYTEIHPTEKKCVRILNSKELEKYNKTETNDTVNPCNKDCRILLPNGDRIACDKVVYHAISGETEKMPYTHIKYRCDSVRIKHKGKCEPDMVCDMDATMRDIIIITEIPTHELPKYNTNVDDEYIDVDPICIPLENESLVNTGCDQIYRCRNLPLGDGINLNYCNMWYIIIRQAQLLTEPFYTYKKNIYGYYVDNINGQPIV